ncbi:MAG TPA: hypothetical protein DDY31_07095 [Lachnospiraceae bacterium]|nr:hypothetical protein [Lachnospiraceae bacterium]
MIGFMPAIYPDELVYSWFCRYYVHSGYSANKMALNDLLYNRHCNPSKEFIGHSLELGFAAYMEKIFDSPVDFENDIPVSAILYFGMEGTKYMSGTGRVRNTRLLADDMMEFFSQI